MEEVGSSGGEIGGVRGLAREFRDEVELHVSSWGTAHSALRVPAKTCARTTLGLRWDLHRPPLGLYYISIPTSRRPSIPYPCFTHVHTGYALDTTGNPAGIHGVAEACLATGKNTIIKRRIKSLVHMDATKIPRKMPRHHRVPLSSHVGDFLSRNLLLLSFHSIRFLQGVRS